MMDNQLKWHWDEESHPFYSEEVILTGQNNDSVKFSIDDDYESVSDNMKVVIGDTPLCPENYYCWTVFIEETTVNTEIMIGISTVDADYTSKWNNCCRLGMNDKSWIICSGGFLSNNNRAIMHEEWKFFDKDHVTVYLNCPQKSLSFAINGKHIGSEYIDISSSLSLVPVIGSTKRSTVKLISTYECPSNLQLLSVISYIYFISSKAGMPASKQPRSPNNFRVLWLKPIYLLKSNMPPGLKAAMKRNYPWFFETPVHRTRRRPRRWTNFTTVPKLKTFTYPKTIGLKDPFIVPSNGRSSKRNIKFTKCKCTEDPLSCGHRKSKRFLKSRVVDSISSSDDEIFINTKSKKYRNKSGRAINS